MSTIADEEAKAAAWREQQRRRVAAQAARARALAGDPEAANRVYQAWLPWLLAKEQEK